MVIDNDVIKADMENIYSRNIPWDKFQGKTVLVTGAYGMLASYFIFFLIYLNEVQGMKIHILAQGRRPEKMKERFGEIVERDYFTVCSWDISERIPELGDIHYIIHAASLANPRIYTHCPIEVAEPNAIGTYYLLQYAAEHGTDSFLLFSSGDVYGKMNDEQQDITEECMGKVNPLDIHSCYGESKRMAETWCKLFWHEKHVSTKIARLGHTYGPTMNIEDDPRVFASFMRCVVKKQNIEMLSDGKAKRMFCYIADAIAAFGLILLMGKPAEAYNVCNSKEFMSIASLAEIMVALRPELNLKVILKERESQDKYLENMSNKQNKFLDTKLTNLGWKCEFNTAQGFQNVLRYLLDREG